MNRKVRNRDYRKHPTREFVPRNQNESWMLEIATRVGEEYMDFLLGTLRRYGRSAIDAAYREYRNLEDDVAGKLKSKPAYFNWLVQKHLKKQNSSYNKKRNYEQK